MHPQVKADWQDARTAWGQILSRPIRLLGRARRITKQAVVARVLSHYQGDILNTDTVERAWLSLRDEDAAPVRVSGWRVLGGPSEQWFEDVFELLVAKLGPVDRISIEVSK